MEEITKGCALDVDDDDEEPSFYDMLYQPGAKIKFSGHRNTRLEIARVSKRSCLDDDVLFILQDNHKRGVFLGQTSRHVWI